MKKTKLLREGDSIGTVLSINMPVNDDRGSPWVKAEVSNTTSVQKGESYPAAAKRSSRDARKRLDDHINYLIKAIKKANRA